MPRRVVNPLPGQPRKVKEPWVEEYEKAFWRYYVRVSGVVDEEHSIYGWEDYRLSQAFRDHMGQCKVDQVQTQMPEDCSWEEFAGTFTDNDTVHGLHALVTCECGKEKRVRTKYRGTLSDLILGVLNAANDGTGEEDDS